MREVVQVGSRFRVRVVVGGTVCAFKKDDVAFGTSEMFFACLCNVSLFGKINVLERQLTRRISCQTYSELLFNDLLVLLQSLHFVLELDIVAVSDHALNIRHSGIKAFGDRGVFWEVFVCFGLPRDFGKVAAGQLLQYIDLLGTHNAEESFQFLLSRFQHGDFDPFVLCQRSLPIWWFWAVTTSASFALMSTSSTSTAVSVATAPSATAAPSRFSGRTGFRGISNLSRVEFGNPIIGVEDRILSVEFRPEFFVFVLCESGGGLLAGILPWLG